MYADMSFFNVIDFLLHLILLCYIYCALCKCAFLNQLRQKGACNGGHGHAKIALLDTNSRYQHDTGCVYHNICLVRRTNRKMKCTSTTHDWEEARDRLTHRRQSLTLLKQNISHVVLSKWRALSCVVEGGKPVRTSRSTHLEQWSFLSKLN